MAKRRSYLLILSLLTTCAPDRGRPGPPSINIAVRAGSTVYSPDPLPFTVTASDTDGLDSLLVTFLDSTVSVQTSFESEVQKSFLWPIRPGMVAGRVLALSARATDVRGLVSVNSVNLTVISRPVPTHFRR